MSKTRNSGRRADAMRAAILAGARRLFLAHGFERTSMDAVAGAIAVSKMTVYRLVHSGELPAVRFGRSYRVPESAVTEALQRPIADVG